MSDTPSREAAPGFDAPAPAEETTGASAPPDPALDEEARAGAPPAAGPAAPPDAPEARQARHDEWESRRYESLEARETIEGKLRDAEGLAQGTQGTAGYRRAEALLNEVRTLLGSKRPGSPGRVLVGPDRRACWDHWRHARDALQRVRDRQQEQDYQALAAPVAEVNECARSGAPYEAIRRVKELQARLGQAYLRRGQFEDLRKRLSEAWQAAQARITEQRQERSKSRDEWRTRMEGHVARWRGTLEQKKGQREHLLQQAAKLEGMERSARSEDFALQVHGWSQENAEKLRRTEESITELEERIRTTAKKLGGRSAATRTGAGGAPTGPASPADAGDAGDETSPGPPQGDPPGPPEPGS